MENPVLVAFATKYGATAEIAQRIGQTLRQAGQSAEVLPVDRVKDPAQYKAVVLGSAVYIGQWRKAAALFLRSHEKMLADRPVWLFSSGPTGEGDMADLLQGWRFPRGLKAIADRIHPRDIAVFYGSVNPAKLNWLEKWMLRNVKAPAGDFRDWTAIEAWGESIAKDLMNKTH